jgi:hypothetical protein
MAYSRGSIAVITKAEELKRFEASTGNEGEYENAMREEEGYKAAQSQSTLYPHVRGDLGNPTIQISDWHQSINASRR